MKKILVLLLMILFVSTGLAQARTENNQARSSSRVNHVREIYQPTTGQRPGMAAAKIDYTQELYKPVGKENLKNNYIQDKTKK